MSESPRLPEVSANLPPDAAERHTFIGGSEAYELLNERQYGRGCVRALAYRKRQTPEDVPEERRRWRTSMAGVLKRGQLLEDVAAQLYMNETGRSLIRRRRMVRNPDHPGAAVHTDRIILADPRRETSSTGDAEIKTHGEGPFLNILRNGLPPAHNLQLQWSLFCTGHQWGTFIILGIFGGDALTGLPLKYFDVERDGAIMNLFATATDNFWQTLKAGELPPHPFPADDVRCKVCPYRLTCRGEMLDPEELHRLMAEREGRKPLKSLHHDELDQALADRAYILGQIEALTSEDEEFPGDLQLVTARIKELLDEIGEPALLVNKRWKLYYSEGVWSGLDQKRLRAEEPAVYDKYRIDRRPTGSKRLTVYAMHDGTGA